MNDSNKSKLSLVKSELGRNLYIARKAFCLSQLELVELTGLTRPIISTIESGKSNPTINSIVKLSGALCLSNEMLLMTGAKVKVLQILLKQSFTNYLLQEAELYIPKKEWNNLIKYSEAVSRTEIGKIANTCRNIININYPEHDTYLSQNMILGATLGVIHQSDGFSNGLNFGAWLGKNFCS